MHGGVDRPRQADGATRPAVGAHRRVKISAGGGDPQLAGGQTSMPNSQTRAGPSAGSTKAWRHQSTRHHRCGGVPRADLHASGRLRGLNCDAPRPAVYRHVVNHGSSSRLTAQGSRLKNESWATSRIPPTAPASPTGSPASPWCDARAQARPPRAHGAPPPPPQAPRAAPRYPHLSPRSAPLPAGAGQRRGCPPGRPNPVAPGGIAVVVVVSKSPALNAGDSSSDGRADRRFDATEVMLS